MIIFGAKQKFRTTGEGRFFCPNCGQERDYERKTGRNYLELYFIPVLPIGAEQELIECSTCHHMYEPSVLEASLPAQRRDLPLPEQINQLEARLRQGEPVEYALRDLVMAGLEREVALTMIRSHIGTARRTCPDCGLSYASSVDHCIECQHPLSE